MTQTVTQYIKSNLKDGSVVIKPYSKDIRDMGFYMIIHPSTRIIGSKASYQCTLFLNETPYCHDFRPLYDIVNHIESNGFKIEDNILYSYMCDDGVIELSKVSKIPDNKKTEDIQKLVEKYNDKLCLIQEEQDTATIKSLFKEYIETDVYSIDQVESILESLLK